MAYRVQCATYNGHLAKGHDLQDPQGGLGAWLGPALGNQEAVEEAPDFVAVGLQELMPLHLALAGFSSTSLALSDSQLQAAIESRFTPSASSTSSLKATRASYTRIAVHSIGGIALIVYARRGTVAERVQSIEVSTAGCGVLGLMGNKGAVGVRVTLVEPEAEKGKGGGQSVFTFVTAHLAAHQGRKYLDRRNADWRSIVQRLVFVGEDGRERQLFDTGNVFFFGDLNYRISLTTPTPLPYSGFSSHLAALTSSSSPPSAQRAYSSLLPHDQLTQERLASRTLHHLREGDIAFPPSYKFKLGTSEYKMDEKKVPSWTDRILYASAAGEEVKVERYDSVMDFKQSDHKPVTALFYLPRSSASTSRLPFSSPFPIDPSWRLKKALGLVLDRFVGSVWCIVMLAGFNRDARVGLANLLLAALTIYYRRYWM
ncbi:hypothetical protein JCM11251_000207 [Rhodosporidiobolus azoricus]